MDYVAEVVSRIIRPWFETQDARLFMGLVVTAAIFFAVGGIFMKLSDGLTRLGPTLVVFALFVAGASLQTIAMQREDLAVTYLIVVGLEAILALFFWGHSIRRELLAGAGVGRDPHCRRYCVAASIDLGAFGAMVRNSLRWEFNSTVGCRRTRLRMALSPMRRSRDQPARCRYRACRPLRNGSLRPLTLDICCTA
jgi:multidrug transporter EmrE-like cation transporter